MTASKLGSGVDRAKVIPFPPIERMGVIGDRRTAALVGADGTLCWMCLPNYDGSPVFGCLLDPLRGGYWKFGPRRRCLGRQDYMPDTAILTTRWDIQGATLELVDAMAWPHDDRGKENVIRRVVLRRLRCLEGSIECELSCAPRRDFENDYAVRQLDAHTVAFTGLETLALWCSSPLAAQDDRVDAAFRLDVGQEIWCVFGPREEAFGWTAEKAAEVMQSTADFWNGWLKPVAAPGRRRDHIRRSALLVHLLTFADTGAVIAAPTTSLPERIGGGRNYDYRFTWIRDASLSLAFLAKLGLTADAKRYMHWLAGLDAEDGAPLQVLYRIDGGRETPLVERGDLHGYRGSRPVRFGNIASQLVENDSFGYLADCIITYLDHGGEWECQFWSMIRRIADYTASNWHGCGSSIWEITPTHPFVVSRVMSWVTLDRALRIAERVGERGPFLATWMQARDAIHTEVMTRGWSDRLGSFRQRYDADAVDAALLLIPIMKFLPLDHPRVSATIDRIIEHLDVNGFLHRFVPRLLPDQGSLPLGEEEGAFLMCSFWLAQVHALRGECNRADVILSRAERIAGPLCLFSEAVDGRSDTFLGNMPLLFSQVEYGKAAIALSKAESIGARRR